MLKYADLHVVRERSGRVLDSRPGGLQVRASQASLHCVLETFILA